MRHAWRLLRRREEAGAKERRKRALEAQEGVFGGDEQMRLTSLGSLMEGIRVADGLRTVVKRLSLFCMGAQGVRGRAILETATGWIGKGR